MLLITGSWMIGIWGNRFIVLVNYSGWLKKRAVSLTDVILVSLATSRICFFGVLYIWMVLLWYSFQIHTGMVR